MLSATHSLVGSRASTASAELLPQLALTTQKPDPKACCSYTRKIIFLSLKEISIPKPIFKELEKEVIN